MSSFSAPDQPSTKYARMSTLTPSVPCERALSCLCLLFLFKQRALDVSSFKMLCPLDRMHKTHREIFSRTLPGDLPEGLPGEMAVVSP